MKAFVTGGSGFLGINLIRDLLKRGCQVVSYDIAPFDYPEADRVCAIVGDIRDREVLDKAIQGCAAAVHCAARGRRTWEEGERREGGGELKRGGEVW